MIFEFDTQEHMRGVTAPLCFQNNAIWLRAPFNFKGYIVYSRYERRDLC